ncbi:hypothetical protein [Actinoplanes derwentensis]|uniref:Immunity protein 35 n=1 Tax=Actinoplanes derwentensis TaxID=113562 RepID=A0A1H2CVN2_9ACTN|nr:hypothetical protein [Actinoplanes derwentensis]GID88328.1 hypothetical protein Ade03nite_72520 [Actinoplanes derwentensis]SDT74610.1 hypothetical protein SAMN04489716_7035 [Actinoplanes derwentensis]
MVDRGEALEIAAWWIEESEPELGPVELGCHEFDQGFVIWIEEPPRPDPNRPPESVGTACLVVDRASGELSVWPPMAALEIAEQYAGGTTWA